MKKLILLILLLNSTNAFSNELLNFNQIKEQATTGKTIHIAINFSKCSSQNKASEHISIGVFTPNTLQIKNNYIATSLTHFTLNNIRFPEKPVYEFVSYLITEDNNVNLSTQVLDAQNYMPLTEKLLLKCKIGLGANIYD